MKKGMSRILSALLVSVLVISSAEVAHAEEATEPANEGVQLVEMAGETAPAAVDEEVPEMEEEVQEVREPKAGSTELQSLEQRRNLLGSGDVSWGKKQAAFKHNGAFGVSEPVNLTAGTVLITAVHKSGENAMKFGVYTDDLLLNAVADGEQLVSKGSAVTYAFRVPASGQYHIGIHSNVTSDNEVYAANVTYVNLSGLDRTIGNDQNILVGQMDVQTNYFTFKAPYTGGLQIIPLTREALYNKVALCNSGKGALTDDLSMDYVRTYGVKAGTTYCIRIQAGYNSNGVYGFKVVNTPVKEKSGKTKKKAVTVKRNKTKKGTILIGNKQADWYKFKLTKKKAVTIAFKGATNDQLKVTVYKGGKKIGTRTYSNLNNSLTLKSSGKWSKGTYYIKVQRGTATSSGWYSFKWK